MTRGRPKKEEVQTVYYTQSQEERQMKIIQENCRRLFGEESNDRVGRLCNIDGGTIGKIMRPENPIITLDSLLKIANAYGVTPGSLLDDQSTILTKDSTTGKADEDQQATGSIYAGKTLWDVVLAFNLLDLCCDAEVTFPVIGKRLSISLKHPFLYNYLIKERGMKNLRDTYVGDQKEQGESLWNMFIETERKNLQKKTLDVYSVKGLQIGRKWADDLLRRIRSEILKVREEADERMDIYRDEAKKGGDPAAGPAALFVFFRESERIFFEKLEKSWRGPLLMFIEAFAEDTEARGAWDEFIEYYSKTTGDTWDAFQPADVPKLLLNINNCIPGTRRRDYDYFTPTPEQQAYIQSVPFNIAGTLAKSERDGLLDFLHSGEQAIRQLAEYKKIQESQEGQSEQQE